MKSKRVEFNPYWDDDYIQSVLKEELAFWKGMQWDPPLELSSDDYVTIDDPESLAAADSYQKDAKIETEATQGGSDEN